jgi:hypothetical protein
MSKRSILIAIAFVAGISIWVVGQTTLSVPGDYSDLPAALDAAGAGDVIEIAPGTYAVNLLISKDVEIRAEVADSPPILEPKSWDLSIITVQSDSSVLVQNIAVQSSYGIAFRVKDGAQLDLLDCTFSENEMDLHISGSSTARLSGCSFSHFYQYSIRVVEEANLDVLDCQFEIPVTLDAIVGEGSGELVISNSKFIAYVDNLYEEFVGAICVRAPSSLVVSNCDFTGLGMAIHGNSYRYFSIHDCTFNAGLFGVHLGGRTGEPWELGEIADCTFTLMGQPIKLYGQIGLIDISGNLIQDTTEGPAIGLCLDVCGGCPHGIPPFVGEISGAGNVIDDGQRRSCPPYRAPFWPDGFLK